MKDANSGATGLWAEIKRRKVVRVALAYIVVGWVLIQVADATLEPLHLPDWAGTLVIWLIILGFPLAVILAWTLDVTPRGIEVTKPAGVAASPELPPAGASIAVLPFNNMSEDAANEYFSDGITEEILNLLSKISDLRVVSRSSAFAYKGKEFHVPDVAAKLNVAHVLEGSVRKAGNRVRITAQLIDARSDSHVWSETFDRTLEDIFAVQDEIAASVSSALKLTLVGGAPTAPVTVSDAHDLYLQGIHFFNRRTEAGFKKAIEYFRQSLDLDPDYGPTWLMLGKTHIIMADMGFIPWKEGYAIGRDAGAKALRLDPHSPATHVHIAWIAWAYDHDCATAARHFLRALELQPNDVATVNNAACFAESIGRQELAITLVKRAIRLEPAGPIPYVNLSQWYAAIGRLDESDRVARKAIELNPEIYVAPSQLAFNRLLRGDPERALELTRDQTFEMLDSVIKAMALFELGDVEGSDEVLASYVERHADRHAYYIAMVYAWRRENDQAFRWLDRAIEEQQNLDRPRVEPFFRNLHDDPRWQPTLARIGFADSQVDGIEFDVKLPD
jgi:adenylate cyclase